MRGRFAPQGLNPSTPSRWRCPMPRVLPRDRPDSREGVRELVRTGWDRVSYRYRPRRRSSDTFGHTDRSYRTWLGPILRTVPPGSRVLDLGSGTGVPVARVLSVRFRVTGVDLSDVQVRRARRLVPRARFVRGDISQVEFSPSSFAAVTALYSIIHLPREEHRPLFRKIATWLTDRGWFLVIAGRSAYEGCETGWLGSTEPMFWSHYDAATYRRMLRTEGFRIVHEEFVLEGDGGHQLFLARKEPPGGTPRINVRRGRAGSGTPAPFPPLRSRARRPRGGRAPLPSRSR